VPGQVSVQTRLLLAAYIEAAQERKLPAEALRKLAAALPKLPPLRGSTGYGTPSHPPTPADNFSTPAAGKRKLRIGKDGEIHDPAANPGAQHVELTPGGLPRGCKVAVSGLHGAPQHNGKEGRVESFVRERGRYVVSVSSGETLSLKPDNLLTM
jgi:hypothetical protein